MGCCLMTTLYTDIRLKLSRYDILVYVPIVNKPKLPQKPIMRAAKVVLPEVSSSPVTLASPSPSLRSLGALRLGFPMALELSLNVKERGDRSCAIQHAVAVHCSVATGSPTEGLDKPRKRGDVGDVGRTCDVASDSDHAHCTGLWKTRATEQQASYVDVVL